MLSYSKKQLKRGGVHLVIRKKKPKKQRGKVDPKQLQKLIENTDMSQVALAEHFGVCRRTIINNIQKLNLKVDWRARYLNRKKLDVCWDTIYLEWLGGATQEELARTYKCCRLSIIRILRHYRKDFKAKLRPPYQPGLPRQRGETK